MIRESIQANWHAASLAAEAYVKNMRRELSEDKTPEERKDEEVRVKPPLPTGNGSLIDFYA